MTPSPQRPQSAETSSKRRIVFRWKEDGEVSSAALAGSFTSWQPLPLKPGRSSSLERIVYLPPGEHEYKFIVNGEWVDDPMCQDFVPNAFGGRNAVVRLS